MPPMKIQPVDFSFANFRQLFPDNHTKTPPKSRLKRLFDRPLTSVMKISHADKELCDEEPPPKADSGPSSACLTKMVRNFMEESNEKLSVSKCVRNRCNCFSSSSSSNDRSDDELDFFGDFTESAAAVGSSGEASGALKELVPCASNAEMNLLADASKIVDKNKSYKRKNDLRKIITENLLRMGYDSSICKSKWEKTPSYPSGEYEYIDVIMDGVRLLIDIDFRSEFEIARTTGTYKAVLQLLPYIFVGKTDRLAQIVRIVSNAANQSLKKKGMPFPPWRKVEYMQAKWLAPYTRAKSKEAIYFN